ncbi:hypothetical protein NFI96_009748 [Prochilodus magdalenae]|nr:hypothetical protein NFI96_009748 [Prochilodus magdalenae]
MSYLCGASENVEQEKRAESQQRRLKDLEVKRRSWAGLDKLGGVFGSRCRSETDVQAALKKEGLFGLLRSNPLSPQSPLGQFGSLRRTRQPLSDGNTDRTGSDTPTDPHSAKMTFHVEAHTLVPALQTFNFDPLPSHHHGNTSTQEHIPQGPGQDSLKVTDNEVNSEMESKGCCEERESTPNTARSETSFSPNQSKGPDAEEYTSTSFPSAPPSASLTDPSALNPIRDSVEPSNHVSEPKPTHLSSLHSRSEAPGSYTTTSTEGAEKPVRQPGSPEDQKAPSKTPGRTPKAAPTSKPAVAFPKSSTSSFSNPSSSTKPHPLHPVRTLTSTETQSMRKVIPLSRNPQTSKASAVPGPAHTPPSQRSSVQRSSVKPFEHSPLEQRSSVKSSEQRSSEKSSERGSSMQRPSMQRSSVKSSMQRSSVKKAVVQPKSPPEEKMCRATLRALAQAAGNAALHTNQNPSHSHGPHFTQGTVASTTRSSSVTPGNIPVKHSIMTTTSKGPSLNRATSLRLAQSGVTSQSGGILQSLPTRSKSVRLVPSAGHIKSNIGSPEKSAMSRDSQNKPHRPVWR